MIDAQSSATQDSASLHYYARHSCALFPIPHGSKDPIGIVSSFKHDWSRDPAQWSAWAAAHPGCNFGVVAFASNWIIADIDVKQGRDAAWQDWCDVCASWGLSGPLPVHVESPSGGWHCYMRLPEGVDACKLRQPDAVKGRINIRCVGYTVAAGSTFEGRRYRLLPDAPPPHPAPAALVAHCSSGTRKATEHRSRQGEHSLRDVRSMLTWMNERGEFDSYEDWVSIGQALKICFWDDGLDLWESVTVSGRYTCDQKWGTFKDTDDGHAVTLATWFQRARKAGWQLTASEIFSGAVPIDSLSPAPAPTGAIPMLGRGEAQAKAWAPVLARIPVLARNDVHPEMPATGHPLRDAINAAIPGIIATRNVDALAVVTAAHADTASAIALLIPGIIDHQAVSNRASGLIEEAEHLLRPADFVRETRTGEIQNDNIDNVAFFLSQLDAEIRWNDWTEAMEVRGWKWDDWTFVDDKIVTLLRARASQTGTRFRVGKDFLWDSLLALSLRQKVDPVLDTLKQLEQTWDGVPRLDTWLHCACGVPNDAYHAAVSRNVIGGMVKRARNPGSKHDEVLLFIGEQGTNKSSVPEILAIQKSWFTDEIELGDPSKELVLSLAGKLVVEIGEMGRKSVAGNNAVKSMLARCVDRGRTAYARTVTARPRRNIFVATTNDPEPLSDLTGNRRWLPVRIGAEIDVEWLRASVAQIVGEAASREAKGETFRVPRELWRTAAEHQGAATEAPEYQNILREWLAPKGLPVFMTIADLSHIAREAAGGRVVKSSEYNRVVEKLGFQRQTKRVDGKPADVWLRGDGKNAYRLTAASLQTMPRGVNLSMMVDAPQPAAAPAFASAVPPPPY